MTPLARRQKLRLLQADVETYSRWAVECPIQAWAKEYQHIAKRLEAEAAALEREQEVQNVH